MTKEIKIEDDGRVFVDGAEFVDREAFMGSLFPIGEAIRRVYSRGLQGVPRLSLEERVKLENPWFHPRGGEDYRTLYHSGHAELGILEGDEEGAAPQGDDARDYIHPKLRPEYAERVAFGMSELAIWQAMGVGIGEEGEERWYFNWCVEFECAAEIENKLAHDALFLTQKDAEDALEEFGGERLFAARLARWGK